MIYTCGFGGVWQSPATRQTLQTGFCSAAWRHRRPECRASWPALQPPQARHAIPAPQNNKMGLGGRKCFATLLVGSQKLLQRRAAVMTLRNTRQIPRTTTIIVQDTFQHATCRIVSRCRQLLLSTSASEKPALV